VIPHYCLCGDDRCAAVEERAGEHATDAAGRSGQQDAAALQVHAHGLPPVIPR